jgi:Tol biopolymer transport system component
MKASMVVRPLLRGRGMVLFGVTLILLAAALAAAALSRPNLPVFGAGYSDCVGHPKISSYTTGARSEPLFFVSGKRLAAPGMSSTDIERSTVSWLINKVKVSRVSATSPVRIVAATRSSSVLWSPSVWLFGDAMVYVEGTPIGVGEFGGEGDVVRSQANGTDIRVLRKYGTDTDPVWSPSGAELAVVDDGNVFVMSDTGRHVREVAGIDDAETLTWSPNGKCIAVSEGEVPSRVAVVSVRTGAYLWVTPAASEAYYPAWSPNGEELAYTSTSGRLILRNLATGRTTLLAACGASSGCTQVVAPTWSPDGSMIAYTRNDSGVEQVCVIPSAGGVDYEVTTGPVQHAMPAW